MKITLKMPLIHHPKQSFPDIFEYANDLEELTRGVHLYDTNSLMSLKGHDISWVGSYYEPDETRTFKDSELYVIKDISAERRGTVFLKQTALFFAIPGSDGEASWEEIRDNPEGKHLTWGKHSNFPPIPTVTLRSGKYLKPSYSIPFEDQIRAYDSLLEVYESFDPKNMSSESPLHSHDGWFVPKA